MPSCPAAPESSPVPEALAVTRLTLTRFRCYDSARVVADRRPVVLTGPNGAGKTNLLEAISFLAPGRGLRRARLSEVDRIGSSPGFTRSSGPDPAGGWAVAATLETPVGPVEIGTGRDPAGGERRVVRIDGHPVRGQTALAEHVALVWLTPQMDRLFTESGSGRRRFLDRLVFGFDPAHAGRLNRFEHALRERARLLRDGRGDDAWLSGLEDVMATTGIAVAAARREVVARLRVACAQAVGPFPRADLTVAGAVEALLEGQPALVAEDGLRARLRDSRRLDAESGGAAVGPHRSDLIVRFQGPDGDMPADRCSTGEQKALLIAIILANARLMAAERLGPPLMLLDEVAAHLDEDRRRALFGEILALGGQAWLTGTDAAVFAGLGDRVRRFRIDRAHITESPA